MTKYPQTKEEAQTFRYFKWAGNPRGTPWNPMYCAEGVWSTGRGSTLHQCASKPGHGPDRLYCAKHAVKYNTSEGEEWFKTSRSAWSIEAVRVIKETESRVWVKPENETPRQEAKRSDWYNYHRTKEEAVQFLRTRTEMAIASAEANIAELKRNLEKLNNL